MTLSTVILDADGVMNDGRLFSLEEDFGIPSERIAPFFRDVFPACLIGKADLREQLSGHLDAWGWRGTVDELLAYWFQQGSKVNETVRKTVQQLRSLGVPIHLATNQEKLRAEYMHREMGYGDLFTALHASSHVGHVKPSREFFATVFEHIPEEDPARILFWDDMEKNVQAAQEFGFTAHQFIDDKDFLTKMRGYFPELH